MTLGLGVCLWLTNKRGRETKSGKMRVSWVPFSPFMLTTAAQTNLTFGCLNRAARAAPPGVALVALCFWPGSGEDFAPRPARGGFKLQVPVPLSWH